MSTATKTSVIFDTDPGADDALALLWLCALHARGRIALAGLTAVSGNVGARDTFVNAERLLQLCGMPDVPLARGEERPGDNATHVHGQDGLAGLRAELPPAVRTYARAPDAAQSLCDAWRQEHSDATLIAVGPLTNLAAAARLDAQALRRIGRIVVMGGALGAGNITPYAEFNAFHDPYAWQYALANARLEVVVLEQTHRVFFDHRDVARVDLPGPVGAFANKLIRQMCEDGARRTGTKHFFLHDAVAVAAVCYPQTVRFRDVALHVTVVGERRGAVHELAGQTPNARVAHDLDPVAIKHTLLDDLRWFCAH